MTEDRASFRIVPLGDRPESVSLLAEWFHAEWAAFDGRSREKIAMQLSENLRLDGIPITFLAVRGEAVIGTVSLDVADLPSHDPLTPWLASLYVVPEARGLGVATGLIGHLLAFAGAHGVRQVHLWTAGSTNMYERLGWKLLDRSTLALREIQILVRDV